MVLAIMCMILCAFFCILFYFFGIFTVFLMNADNERGD